MEVKCEKRQQQKRRWLAPQVTTQCVGHGTVMLACTGERVDCDTVFPGCGCQPGSDLGAVCENACSP